MKDKHFSKLKWISALSIVYFCCTWRCVESACPEGYKERGENCCLPTTCSINQGYRLCNGHRGNDTCYACPSGTVSQAIVNTADFNYELPLCKGPNCYCPPEGMLLNEYECRSTGKKVCQCDRQRGYYGYDVNICLRVNTTVLSQIQRPGYELKLDGKILACDEGYFKDRPDNSTCVPMKRCPLGFKVVSEGSITHDRVCQKIIGPETTVTSLFPSTEEKHVTSVSHSGTSALPIPSLDNDDTIAAYLIIIICLSVCLVLVSCILLYLKCKGRRLEVLNWIQNIRQKCSCNHHAAVPTSEPEQEANSRYNIPTFEHDEVNNLLQPDISNRQPQYPPLSSSVGETLNLDSLLSESEHSSTHRTGHRERDQRTGHSRIPVEHEEQTISSQMEMYKGIEIQRKDRVIL